MYREALRCSNDGFCDVGAGRAQAPIWRDTLHVPPNPAMPYLRCAVSVSANALNRSRPTPTYAVYTVRVTVPVIPFNPIP